MAKIDGFYNNAMLLVASQYAYEKSVQLGIPLILNNISGTNSVVGISSSDNRPQLYFSRGFCFVSAAGDEGNTQTHTSGNILSSGDVQEIEFEVTSMEEHLEIQIWIEIPDTANSINSKSNSGEVSKICRSI